MTQIGNVYGQALYTLAQDEGLSETVLAQLQTLEQVIGQEPDYIRLLSSPNLSKQERCRVLDDGFRGKVHAYVLNFLKILTEKGYMRHFADCCNAFQEQYNLDHGILPVTAVTAVPLSGDQAQKLSGKLSRITGKQVQLCNRVDSGCIGGVRLDYDGKCLDDTVLHRMNAIRTLLKDTVL